MNWKQLTLLSATLIGSTLANASDVTLSGTITPVACTFSLSGSEDFKLPDVAYDQLHPTGYSRFETPAIPVTIQCPSKMRVLMQAIDTYRGWADGDTVYDRFGLKPLDNKAVGYYTLRMANDTLVVDGNSQSAIFMHLTQGNFWSRGPASQNLRNGQANVVSAISLGGVYRPASYQKAEFEMTAIVDVRSKRDLPPTDQIPLIGHATVELIY